MYVNGVEITYSTSDTVDHQVVKMNNSAYTTYALAGVAGTESFDGYIAEFHNVDGQVLTPSDFGETNAQGHWIPKAYAGTYGDAGWYQDYAVAPGTGNGAGTDVSGNANHLTDSGLAANDQKTDTPTNNCATWNTAAPLVSSLADPSNGNLDTLGTVGAAWRMAEGTMWAETGKWYYEIEADAIGNEDEFRPGWTQFPTFANIGPGNDNFSWGLQYVNASTVINVVHAGGATAYTDTGDLSAGNGINVAIDIDAGKIWFGNNGTWFDSGDPGAGTGGHSDATISSFPGRPTCGIWSNTNRAIVTFNRADMAYTVPTGFKTFQVSELDDPTYAPIPKGSDYFDIRTYGGSGSNPSNPLNPALDFQPDLVMVKSLSGAFGYTVWDSVRGGDENLFLHATSAEAVVSAIGGGGISGVTSNNIAVDAGSASDDNVNDAAYTYIAWCWKESPTAGFDIAGYVADGLDNFTFAHSLGVAPDFIIGKNRDSVTNWISYHANMLDASGVPVSDPETDYMSPNLTLVRTDLDTIWSDVAPDASNVTLGTNTSLNGSGDNVVAYLFKGIPGFSRFGTYIGNGNADGPFVWCGFRPKFILTKNLANPNVWYIIDSERDGGINPIAREIRTDTSGAETTATITDFLANGFKVRDTDANTNTNADEFLYVAFAEHPFKYARAF
jgi:hypothetical protein